MKTIHKVLSCSCVLLLSLQTPAFSDFTHTPGKSSVIVLQGEVTVDGQQRPDLGRSFADTITGGLLKTKAYAVIDHLGTQPLSEAIQRNPNIPPEQSAVSFAKEAGARWIYVPRMIAEGDFHKLTLKKIRVSDGQVVDVFETYATGDRSTMFVLIGDALKQIYYSTARDSSRLGKTSTGEPIPGPTSEDLDPSPVGGIYRKPPKPRGTPAVKETKVVSANKKGVPDGLKLDKGTHVQAGKSAQKPAHGLLGKPAAQPGAKAAEEPAKIKDPAVETEDQYARYIGTISTINPEWRFCILKLSNSRSLAVGDLLSVKTDKIVPTEVSLEVTKIEGRQAVADLIEGVALEPLKLGQSFYKWVPKK